MVAKLAERLLFVLVFCSVIGATITVINYVEASLRPQEFLKTLAFFSNKRQIHPIQPPLALFDGQVIKKTILGLIDATPATGRIYIATFMFTDQAISDALVQKFKEGTEIVIVADNSCAQKAWSKIPYLLKQGIPIYLYPPPQEVAEERPAIMHNKFMLFEHSPEETITLTGSFNYTHSAAEKNAENIVILNHPETAQDYRKQFEKLRAQAVKALYKPRTKTPRTSKELLAALTLA